MSVAEIREMPLFRRTLPDGRIAELWRMQVYYWITVSLPEEHGFCWQEAWCYDSVILASEAYRRWDGVDAPIGWVRQAMPEPERKRD